MKTLNYKQEFERFLKSRERKYSGLMLKALKAQYDQYLGSGDIEKVTMDSVRKVVENLYKDAFLTYGKKMGLFIKREEKRSAMMGLAADLIEAFRVYFWNDILNISQGITETTKDIIRRVILAGVQEGLNAREVAKEIVEKSEMSAYRALMIVRTETTAAANAGSYFSAQKSRIVMTKVWIAATDNRTRHDHREVNGKTVDLEDSFTVGAYKMLYPGDRGGNGRPVVGPEETINCRCTIGFTGKRDERGRLILKPLQ